MVLKINHQKVFGFQKTIRVSARKAFSWRKTSLFHQTLQLGTLFIPSLISHGGLAPWVNTARPNKFLTQETCPISKKQKEGLPPFFSTNLVWGSKISKSSQSCEEPTYKHFGIELHIYVLWEVWKIQSSQPENLVQSKIIIWKLSFLGYDQVSAKSNRVQW